MNSKITCKTCGKENVPDWNGKGQCITCSRDEVLGVNSKLRATLTNAVRWLQEYHELETDLTKFEHPAERESFYSKHEQATRKAVAKEMLELVEQSKVDGYFTEWNGLSLVDEAELRQKIKEYGGEK